MSQIIGSSGATIALGYRCAYAGPGGRTVTCTRARKRIRWHEILVADDSPAERPKTPAANPPNDFPPPFRYCGHFNSDYVIHVYAKKMRCRKARAIQREYWNGKERDRTVVNGGSGAFGYVLLDKYPEWRCGSGSGGGACRKGKRMAAYAN